MAAAAVRSQIGRPQVDQESHLGAKTYDKKDTATRRAMAIRSMSAISPSARLGMTSPDCRARLR